MDRATIATHMRALSSLGSRVSLIERAHLGEFSWPFAEIIGQVAERLFVETTLGEELQQVVMEPIVHVVAEGTEYQIIDDEVPPPGERRIIIVAFPRQLKHHVLLHTIFGHELAHTAINAEEPGKLMKYSVLPRAKRGPLQDVTQAKAWLLRADAPAQVRELASRPAFSFHNQWLINWRQEIICDLFGLRLFGPAFVAAHRTIIEALCPCDDFFDLESTTHPPYPLRQRILATGLRVLGWNTPVTQAKDGALHEAEQALLNYVTHSIDDPWFAIYDDASIIDLLSGIREVLSPHKLDYTPPARDQLCELVSRLSQERPPISQSIDNEGNPTNNNVDGIHCLYAGWTYWLGKARLAEEARKHDAHVRELSFLHLNRLCDQALLQQSAINLVNAIS